MSMPFASTRQLSPIRRGQTCARALATTITITITTTTTTTTTGITGPVRSVVLA